MFQEDISKLRGKIEKAKKPAEKISNGDDILNEEINDYKVSLNSALEAESGIEASGCWLRVYNHMCWMAPLNTEMYTPSVYLILQMRTIPFKVSLLTNPRCTNINWALKFFVCVWLLTDILHPHSCLYAKYEVIAG